MNRLQRVDTLKEYLFENEKLMVEWKEKYSDNSSFVEDGIVCAEKWFSLPEQNEKIMFLLKEAYINKSDRKYAWSLTRWIARDPQNPCCEKEFCSKNQECANCTISGKTYNHVAEYAYAVRQVQISPYSFDSWLGCESRSISDYLKIRDDILKEVAIVNIKKCDGKPTSDNNCLDKAVSDDIDLLCRKIELIKPTLIICGGTYKFWQKLYSKLREQNANRYAMFRNIKVIAAMHPNARLSSEKKSDAVAEAYKKLSIQSEKV